MRSFSLSRAIAAAILLVLPLVQVSASEPGSTTPEPIESLSPAAIVKLRAGEYKLLTVGCRVIRLATSDPSVCGAAHYDGRTLALWGRTRGTSDVTLWFEDAARGPLVWAVEVR